MSFGAEWRMADGRYDSGKPGLLRLRLWYSGAEERLLRVAELHYHFSFSVLRFIDCTGGLSVVGRLFGRTTVLLLLFMPSPSIIISAGIAEQLCLLR